MGYGRTLLLSALLLGGSVFTSRAQNWDEVFSQKKTQLKYLGQQIAALQIYIGYARKGYELSSKGMDLVRSFSGGEHALHKGIFSALSMVSPQVRSSNSVQQILSLKAGILAASVHWRIHMLSPSEQTYLRGIKANLLSLCLQDLEFLTILLTSDRFALTVDQRLARVSELLAEMTDKYSFAMDMSTKIRLLLKARAQQSVEAGRMGELNGINLNH